MFSGITRGGAEGYGAGGDERYSCITPCSRVCLASYRAQPRFAALEWAQDLRPALPCLFLLGCGQGFDVKLAARKVILVDEVFHVVGMVLLVSWRDSRHDVCLELVHQVQREAADLQLVAGRHEGPVDAGEVVQFVLRPEAVFPCVPPNLADSRRLGPLFRCNAFLFLRLTLDGLTLLA